MLFDAVRKIEIRGTSWDEQIRIWEQGGGGALRYFHCLDEVYVVEAKSGEYLDFDKNECAEDILDLLWRSPPITSLLLGA